MWGFHLEYKEILLNLEINRNKVLQGGLRVTPVILTCPARV